MSVVTWVGADGSRWPLSGGMSPSIIVQDGVILTGGLKGLMAGWKHLDQASAHQDGTTWLDTVWEPAEVDLPIIIAGQSPAAYRSMQRQWMNSWDPKTTGTLFWWSSSFGEWWLTLRMLQEPGDALKTNPAFQTSAQFTWSARADMPFWSSFDSLSSLVAGSATNLVDPNAINPPNFLPLFNRGDQSGWPRYLAQGPFTKLTIGDANSGATVSFGPIAANTTVLITTLPRIQTVTNLTTGQNLYPLLSGRFQTPIPAGQGIRIPCTVTGATTGVTQINAALTPLRKWPE